MKEGITIRTEGRVILRDANNQIYKVERIYNLITTVGRQWCLKKLIGTAPEDFDLLQIGTNNTTPTLTDLGCNSITTTLPITIIDNIATDNKITITAIIPQAQFIGTNFKECAILLSNGDCFNHSVFSDFTKQTAQVDIEWDIIFS